MLTKNRIMFLAVLSLGAYYLWRQSQSMGNNDLLLGGLADKKKPSDFNKTQLEKGTLVELEHTSSKALAQEIAMDHLTEDSQYYVKLAKMETH